MSTARALQTVTIALQNRLKTAVAGAKVHARPPDRVKAGLETAAFLNLFLFEVLPNAAWRNQEYPSRGGASGLRPPLPLDLRYLLTAYPEADDEQTAHGLLGQAMLLLHDDPVLSRAELSAAMDPLDPSSQTGIDVQFEQVGVCQMHLPLDELSKLWTAFGTDYRLSVVYQLSVVLIDPGRPPLAPLPVLQRGSSDPAADEPPTVGTSTGPILDAVVVQAWLPNRSVPSRHLETIVLQGRGLGGGHAFARFYHPSLADPLDVPAVTESASEVTVKVPAALPLGFSSVAVGLDLGGGRAVMSNRLPLAVAPRIKVSKVVAPPADPVQVQVTVNPAPAATVPVLVLFRGAQLLAERLGPGTYQFDAPVPPGATSQNPVKVPVRVRIEGIDSIPLPDPVAGQPLPLLWDEPDQVVSLP
jgi:hypothetical protein